jgi:hypothetical protein
MPESYLMDPEVFPEKEGEVGSIYVEAGDKVTLKKFREITFINARDVLGIIYVSKSGNTRLKWRQIREKVGRVVGEASANSLVNLLTASVLAPEYIEELAKGQADGLARAGVDGGQLKVISEGASDFDEEDLASSTFERPHSEETPHIDENI